jgi:hypothetical protein
LKSEAGDTLAVNEGLRLLRIGGQRIGQTV